jgi:immune inhibitor A
VAEEAWAIRSQRGKLIGTGRSQRGGSPTAQSPFSDSSSGVRPGSALGATYAHLQMEARVRKLITILSSLALLFSLTANGAAAASGRSQADAHAARGDNFPGKLAQKQSALKAQAQEMVLKGQAKAQGPNQVVEVAKGQFVELGFEGEDQILTLLAQFGDGDPTHNHGSFGTITHTGDAYAHNSIPEPDRSVDNTTIWTEDFSQEYYENLLYNKSQVPSMANWYLAQSSGRYSVDGYVGPWVTVPNNPSAYGSNYCGSIVCTRDVGRFMVDQGNAWYAQILTDGMSAAEIDALLAPFDVWDRYDYDGDGDFNEPDGYIDHFQSVHAGEGEETGGGVLGEDAIWSHRSYANAGSPAGTGPTVIGDDGNPVVVPFQGFQLGSSSKWVGDYTIEPENGGVGVFAHEFGHDLGLPDEYDTSGNTGGAENGTAWWTTWSQGSYGTITDDLGSYPVSMTAWERFQLGWLRYGVGFTGTKSSFKLGPVEANTKKLQGVFVVLPDKEITVELGDPFEGSYFYHSGSGNGLNTTMTRPITLGPTPGNLTFKGRWHIEACWDYAYIEVSVGGGPFTALANSAESPENSNGQNDGHGITGTSGTALVCDQFGTPTWVDVTADLTPYANQTIQLRFRYETDGAVVGEGFGVDNLVVDGVLDGAETDPGWTYNGFSRTTGTTTVPFFNSYVAEFRQYRSYDKALELGPYNFVDPAGTAGTPNLVEHFPYQDGLLLWYWDSSFSDNNVGDHPGGGLILPIDSHPDILHWSDGSTARPRIQSYDATFGFEATDAITLHNFSPDVDLTLTSPSQPAVAIFNDNLSYWDAGDAGDNGENGRYQSEWNSVIVPHTGTTIRVVGFSAQGQFMQINVNQ